MAHMIFAFARMARLYLWRLILKVNTYSLKLRRVSKLAVQLRVDLPDVQLCRIPR